jgi:hypothetical protein
LTHKSAARLDPRLITVDEHSVEAQVQRQIRTVARHDAVARTQVDEPSAPDADNREQEDQNPIFVILRQHAEARVAQRRHRTTLVNRCSNLEELAPQRNLRGGRHRAREKGLLCAPHTSPQPPSQPCTITDDGSPLLLGAASNLENRVHPHRRS